MKKRWIPHDQWLQWELRKLERKLDPISAHNELLAKLEALRQKRINNNFYQVAFLEILRRIAIKPSSSVRARLESLCEN